MKVVIDASCINPPLTGVGHYARNIVLRLPSCLPNAELRYFLGNRWSDSLPREVPGHLGRGGYIRGKVKAIPGLRSLWRQAKAALWRRAMVGEPRHPICLAPNFRPPFPWFPTVPVIHDLAYIRFPQTLPRERMIWLSDLGRELQRSPIIVAVSPFTAREISAHFGISAERIRVATPGVAPRFHRDHLGSGSYFLSVCTLEPRKNLAVLVEAYSRLPASIRERLPLVLAGASGWGDCGRSRRWEELMAAGQLRLLNYVADERLPELYGGAMALCVPSLYEGFGMQVAEALAGGVPVLASHAGALPETVGPGGLLLPASDVEAWTNAMDEIAADEHLRQRLSQAGQSHGRSFDWDNSAAVIAAALSDAQAEGRP